MTPSCRSSGPSRADNLRPAFPSWLPLAVALSGAVNLSGEAAWHRLASLTVGDFYVTYAAVMLAFFFGGAAGALIGAVRPRFAWLYEFLPGVWAIGWAAAIRGGVLELDLPAWAGVAAMLPPALALGAHAPLYVAVMRGRRYGAVAAIYHLGGVAGLVAMAWWLGAALPLSGQLALLGAVQLGLAVLLAFGLRGRRPPDGDIAEGLNGLGGRWEIAAVVVGATGFWWTMMALSEQSFLTVPVRLGQAAVIIASVAWFSVGAALSAIWRRPLWWLAAALPAVGLAALAAAPQVAALLAPQDAVPGFFLAGQAVAIAFSAPVALTAAWYALAADRLSGSSNGRNDGRVIGQAWAGGRIAAAAAIGNAIGCLLAFGFGETLAPVMLAAPVVAAGWAERGRMGALAGASLSALIAPLFAATLAGGMWRDYDARLGTYAANAATVESADFVRRGLWWFALEDRRGGVRYVIDGHASHTIDLGQEYLVGLVPGLYFERGEIDRAMVVGIGTGQSAWAVTHLARATDLVDISPIAPLSLERLSRWNGDLLHDPRATIHREDGARFVKRCQAGRYDVVLNTATYPALASAYKLFVDEFVAAAKRCLSAEGVYVTYFDDTVATSRAEMDFLLRPLAARFRHLDIHLVPYPVAVAYDAPRSSLGEALGAALLPDPADRAFLAQRAASVFERFGDPEGAVPDRANVAVRVIRNYRPLSGPRPRLDDGRLERQALRNYVTHLAGGYDQTIYRILEAMWEDREAGGGGDR